MVKVDLSATDAPGLVRAKVETPPARYGHRTRSRLNQLIGEGLTRSRIMLVTATAGSGKTTAVVDALNHIATPAAWFTLDRADVSAGRLLSYLEASVRRVDASIPSAATAALTKGITHPDAAALLAEAIGDRRMIVVFDDVERVADSEAAVEAIGGFLRYLPENAQAIVISRRDVPMGLARQELAREILRIGESDLALTVAEAETLLGDLERDDIDAQVAVESTAGWLTGVLFDSWRSSLHVHGTGGEADALHTYLSSEIMNSLPEDAQHFLIVTSVLDQVTAARADALGLSDTAATLALLRDRHLPVEFPDAHRMRCHPRFREYLLERLAGLEPATVRAIHGSHADLLMEERRQEEAVDEYLRAGDIAQAEDAAAGVVLAVVKRLDIDLAARWLSAFRRWRIESSIVLTETELLVALERERYGIGAECADRLLLLTAGAAERAGEDTPYGAMAWCYFLTGRIDDARRVLAEAIPGPQTAVMTFAIGVELLDSPVHYRDRPADTGTAFDGMLARIDLAHGRFERVLGATSTQFDAIRAARLGALTGLGRLEDALSLVSDAEASAGWTRVRMTAELMADLGRPEDAWSELIKGRDVLATTESTLYRMFASLTEAMLALRFSRDTALAAAILDAVEREPTSLARVRVVEQLALWRGLIALIEGDDDKAVVKLREAVALMTHWDRLLLLPTAAVFLAEAEWHVHEDDAADAAADLALKAADRTGSRHSLIRALREFPAVLSRRLDSETDPDSPWHDLGRAVVMMSDGLRSLPAVHVVEFGEPTILIDGRRQRLKLAKSIEVLSLLASRGGRAPKADIVSGLFDSKNEKAATAYLRMALNRIRDCFPGQEVFSADSDSIAWVHGELMSDYVQLRTRLVRLRNVQGRQRLELAMEALAAARQGEYLPGARSNWATDQRRRWSDLILDVCHVAAEAAFEVADFAAALQLINEVVDNDPYRERAWRLRMRISASVGDGDGVIAAYRACECALSSLSITPTESTRQLLNRLRF